MEGVLAGRDPATAKAIEAGGDLNETYEGYIYKRVLEPLGMRHTFHSATGAPQIINKIAERNWNHCLHCANFDHVVADHQDSF